MKFTVEEWQTLAKLFDEAMDLPEAARANWLASLDAAYASLQPALHHMLARQANGESDDFLNTLPKFYEAQFERPAPAQLRSLSEGAAIGPYRLVRELGRGGMGAVWLAERIDGLIKRPVALKLPHPPHYNSHLRERFARERDILASLVHPNIGKLFDAGVTEAGQPYLGLEYIEGATITEYCDGMGLPVCNRLELFLQVLEAVQYAHSRLVIHRDLKPSNILVTSERQVVLLDFGIAKLLTDGKAKETELTQRGGAALTPDYASPEQITGQAISTASDVYSLGIVLYELLTGERPYKLTRDSRGALEEAILAADPRIPSQVVTDQAKAERRGSTPKKLAHTLAGDLDTIILKALKKRPGDRYLTVNAFAQDVVHYLRGEAVLARPDSTWYRTKKFLGRNRLVAGSVSAVVVALTVGIVIALWQTALARDQQEIANREAKRERTTKDFLLSVFKASDPRIASDKPRGTITAKELLDLSSARIEKDFANDPDTEIQLLGMVADIYGELDENELFAKLNRKQTDLARSRYGETHPLVINGLLKEADDANTRGDYARALQLLDETDRLIKHAGLERSAERAYWWLTRNFALQDAASRQDRVHALERAIDLYAVVAPNDLHYAFALSGLGGIYHGQGNYQRAAQYTRQSIAVVERSPERDDGALSIDYSNLGKTLSYQGDFDGAERAYEHAVQLAKSTYGMDSWYYWVAAGNYAQTVHLRGDLERSRRMFDALLPLLPKEAAKYRNALEENSTARVLELYGSCLSAEGRPQLAIPLLKVAEQGYAEAPTYYYDLNHVRGELGLAYDRLGDTEDARRLLKSALDGYLATAPPDDPGVLQHREAWGAFVLRHGDLTEAGQQLREVLTQAHNRNLFSVALAHGELALLAVLQHDVPAALESSTRAVDVFTNVTGFRDVRMGPYLWRIRAEVLLNAGDAAGARIWAQRAQDAVGRYDDPTSPDIGSVQATLRAAEKAPAVAPGKPS